MYYLNDNVYIVRGAKHICIYDFNRCHVIQCTSDFADIIDSIINEKCNLVLENYNKNKINILIKTGILVTKETGNKGDIKSIAKHSVINCAWIELTNQCNMQCIHCYDEACIYNRNELSLEDFKYVIDELYNFGIQSIQLIGGEPLIVKDFKRMLSYASKKMRQVSVFTNASLITEDVCELFASLNTSVAVSVYSYNEKDHDYVTKINGSFIATTKGLKLLSSYGIKYRVANVRMNGVDVGVKNTNLFSLDKGDIVRIAGRANAKLLNRELIRTKLITEKTFLRGLKKDFCSRVVSFHNCFGRRLYISADMNVYPCVMERRLCHGNLKGNHLKNILKNQIFMLNKDKIDVCNKCEFRYACFDCRPNALTGNVLEKPWYCTYDPYNGTWEEPNKAVERIVNDLNLEN